MKNVLLALLLAVTICFPVPSALRTNTFPDETKHHALLRLEDVGPGNEYTTPDDLGKLRAVFTYLEAEHVPFSVAVIPRSKHLLANGMWYDKGIDDPVPDRNVSSFIALLKDAEQHGAVLGMHGYTHQYGTTKRPDHNEVTGTGREFDVSGAPETTTLDYAADKINKSLAAFAKVGFTPGFWESPHYADTREQEELFRSYMGILYQPDFRSLRSLKDLNVYETENTYGTTTLGSVYVPAPFSYVSGESTVQQDLARLDHYTGLASMFFHPFLEFPYLEPVRDTAGKPVIQNGLPLYRYKAGTPSYLHQLVPGFRQHGFKWVSLYDVVPFSPAHRVILPLGTKASDILIGDVSGLGHADVAVRENNGIEVYEDNYQWPRNRSSSPSTVWLEHSFAPSDRLTLLDLNGDRKQDLLAYDSKTGALLGFLSDGDKFGAGVSAGQLPAGMDEVLPFNANGDGRSDLLLRKQQTVYVALNANGHFQPPQKVLELPAGATLLHGDLDGDKRDDVFAYQPHHNTIELFRNTGDGQLQPMPQQITLPQSQATVQVLAADTNGDGHVDLIVDDAASGVWQVLQGSADFRFQPIDNAFGPWAGGTRTAFAADFDGNGHADIAAYDATQHLLDLALSFRK